MRVYLDKVLAIALKARACQLWKVLRDAARSFLAVIKFSYKTVVRRRQLRINGKERWKKRKHLYGWDIVSRYGRAFKKVASTRLLWTRDMIHVTCIKRLHAYPRNARKIADAKCMRFMLLANDLSRSLFLALCFSLSLSLSPFRCDDGGQLLRSRILSLAFWQLRCRFVPSGLLR